MMEEIGVTITSHCKFYGARCATTHDEPPFPSWFARYSRLVPSFNVESLTLEIGATNLLIQPYSSHEILLHSSCFFLSFIA